MMDGSRPQKESTRTGPHSKKGLRANHKHRGAIKPRHTHTVLRSLSPNAKMAKQLSQTDERLHGI